MPFLMDFGQRILLLVIWIILLHPCPNNPSMSQGKNLFCCYLFLSCYLGVSLIFGKKLSVFPCFIFPFISLYSVRVDPASLQADQSSTSAIIQTPVPCGI